MKNLYKYAMKLGLGALTGLALLSQTGCAYFTDRLLHPNPSKMESRPTDSKEPIMDRPYRNSPQGREDLDRRNSTIRLF